MMARRIQMVPTTSYWPSYWHSGDYRGAQRLLLVEMVEYPVVAADQCGFGMKGNLIMMLLLFLLFRLLISSRRLGPGCHKRIPRA